MIVHASRKNDDHTFFLKNERKPCCKHQYFRHSQGRRFVLCAGERCSERALIPNTSGECFTEHHLDELCRPRQCELPDQRVWLSGDKLSVFVALEAWPNRGDQSRENLSRPTRLLGWGVAKIPKCAGKTHAIGRYRRSIFESVGLKFQGCINCPLALWQDVAVAWKETNLKCSPRLCGEAITCVPQMRLLQLWQKTWFWFSVYKFDFLILFHSSIKYLQQASYPHSSSAVSSAMTEPSSIAQQESWSKKQELSSTKCSEMLDNWTKRE